MAELTFDDDTANRRFRALLEGSEVGFIEYDPIGSDGVLLKHTEVHPGHEGRGYGSKLVAAFLDDARRRSKAVVPICPYAMGFIRRHHEYLDVVREDMRGTL
jgi:predicted GNAT family acetyltransferase